MKRNALVLVVCVMAISLFSCKKDDKLPVVTGTTNNPPVQPNTIFASPQALFASFAPTPKSYTISTGSSYSQIITPSGLKLYFWNSDFVDLNNNAVTGNIELRVTEYNTKASMLFGRVTTVSNGKLLVSGGMYNIEAYQGTTKLKLKAGAMYNMIFPLPLSGQRDIDMKLFAGQSSTDETNPVNWTETKDQFNWLDSTKGYAGRFDSLKFVNLDKYYNTDKPQTHFHVKLPVGYTNANTFVSIILEGRGITGMSSDAVNKRFTTGSYTIAEGTKIKVLAVSIINKVLRYAIKEVTITTELEETLTTFTEISENDLETLVNGL